MCLKEGIGIFRPSLRAQKLFFFPTFSEIICASTTLPKSCKKSALIWMASLVFIRSGLYVYAQGVESACIFTGEIAALERMVQVVVPGL